MYYWYLILSFLPYFIHFNTIFAFSSFLYILLLDYFFRQLKNC